MARTILDRLEQRSFVDKTRSYNNINCKRWKGVKAKQQGQIRYRGKMINVHRLAAHIFWGFDLDSSLYILHRCNTPGCWETTHLYEGTHTDNMEDLKAKNIRALHAG